MNLHVHIHAAAVYGLYTTDDARKPRSHFLPPLRPTDIHWICSTVATRVCNLLRRRGLLRDRVDDNNAAVRLAPSTALDACRQAAISRGRGAPPPVCSGAPAASPALDQAPAPQARTWRSRTSYVPRAELMRRTLDIDPAHCRRWEGRLESADRDHHERRSGGANLVAPELARDPMGPGGSLAWDLGDERTTGCWGWSPSHPRRGRTAAGATVRPGRGPADAGLLKLANCR
jgi:hypothetical protein